LLLSQMKVGRGGILGGTGARIQSIT